MWDFFEIQKPELDTASRRCPGSRPETRREYRAIGHRRDESRPTIPRIGLVAARARLRYTTPPENFDCPISGNELSSKQKAVLTGCLTFRDKRRSTREAEGISLSPRAYPLTWILRSLAYRLYPTRTDCNIAETA
jgi:hypothetical protein